MASIASIPPGTRRIPGHEVAGTVLNDRSHDERLRPGTRVVIAPNIACGECCPCHRRRQNLCEHYASMGLTCDGGFAEQMLIPAAAVRQGNVLVVPEGLDLGEENLPDQVRRPTPGGWDSADPPAECPMIERSGEWAVSDRSSDDVLGCCHLWKSGRGEHLEPDP